MNKLFRIILIVFVCFASFNFVRDAYLGGDINRDLTVLVIGLIGGAILLTGDVIEKMPRSKIHFTLTPFDYAAVVLWPIVIISALNESQINHSIHEILNLKRNLLVFEIVNWLIILTAVAAIGALAASLFVLNRAIRRPYSLRLIIPIALGILLTLSLTVPIETVRVGTCGRIKPTRLSLIGGGQQQIEQAKQQVRDEELKAAHAYGGIFDTLGCSAGPVYELYIL